jgi:hypothetical protein
MSKANRVRIDYSPGAAALEALQAAQELHPKDSTQALLDRLVITGLSALVHGHWEAPKLHGSNRDCWQLPRPLRRPSPEPTD